MVGDSRAESAPGGLASSDDGDLAGVGDGGVGVDEMQRGLTGRGVSFPLYLSRFFFFAFFPPLFFAPAKLGLLL